MFYCGILCALCLFDFLFGDVIVVDLILVENDVSPCLWLGNIVLVAKEVWYRLIQVGSKKPLHLNWLWVKLLEYIKAGLPNKEISKRTTWLHLGLLTNSSWTSLPTKASRTR